MASRLKEFLKKYGKVGLGVHFSVSTASISGLYVAIKNNVDVESIIAKWHLPGLASKNPDEISDGFVVVQDENPDLNDSVKTTSTVVIEEGEKKRNRTAQLAASNGGAQLAASNGGALALAVLCNKALFPVRLPITIALTRPVARFLARGKIYKNSA